MVLFLILVLVFLLGIASGLLLQNARLRELSARVNALETRRTEPLRAYASLPESPLAGVRVKLDIHQDHPLGPFETLLAEFLAHAGAIRVYEAAHVQIDGTLKGNGYADVYFGADLTVRTNGQTLFRLLGKPPHGDRPENLAREVATRLAAEWAKQERQGALRELSE